jgi:uncharacterized protein YukE
LEGLSLLSFWHTVPDWQSRSGDFEQRAQEAKRNWARLIRKIYQVDRDWGEASVSSFDNRFTAYC